MRAAGTSRLQNSKPPTTVRTPASPRPVSQQTESPDSPGRFKPRKITVKSAPAARPPDGASATPDCDLPRLVRRLSEGWQELSLSSSITCAFSAYEVSSERFRAESVQVSVNSAATDPRWTLPRRYAPLWR